ncbi:hypothetical protein HHI36_002106 [Cryptolaemus montrouzieri]|uniref:Uncharacterized protein n=1 Tax=Cryptolaemus montrouzieri TaxID=559131 RepID=A0ABD2PAC7_9CUCU
MNSFTPVMVKESPVAASPGKNLTGSPRVARDVVADFYNTIQKWNDVHIRGAHIVKQIASIKAENLNSYPDILESPILDLFNLCKMCSDICLEMSNFSKRMIALSKLHKEETYLFISLTVEEMADNMNTVYKAYDKELKNKQLVLENVAHSKSKSEAMFFAALWSYQINITSEITLKLEALLTETGHRKIS